MVRYTLVNYVLNSKRRSKFHVGEVHSGEYIMMLTWTDDFPYFGTPKMVSWFNTTLPTLIKVDLVGQCRDFISIEVTQHEDGSKEATHSKYWLALGEKYADQLVGRNMKIPMKPGVDKQLLVVIFFLKKNTIRGFRALVHGIA